MALIDTVPLDQATGTVAELYAADRDASGHVPNFAQAFSLRPDVYRAWRELNGAVKAGMDLRRYELATVAAARRLKSSYCALAHGSVLAEKFLTPETVCAVMSDHRSAGLDPLDMAVIALAEKVVDDASAIAAADFADLRALGLSDAEIFDVVLAAAARCFFSKALDGVGAQPDGKYAKLEPGLRDALTVGRPIAED
jgi:uncharacterized peroxidase-related enzyme